MQKRALIVGGTGCLGRELLKTFKLDPCWWVSSLAFEPVNNIDCNFVLTSRDDLSMQCDQAISQIDAAKEKLGIADPKFLDAVICVAGGWRGGNAASKKFISNCETVVKQSIWSSLVSANLSSKFLKPGGLLLLSGALPSAVGGTPGMIGYGMAKAAVHHLVQSLACEKSGLPPDTNVVAILPSMIDTPSNRKGLPENADTSNYTKMEEFCDVIHKWASDPRSRHPSGSLVKFETVNNKTTVTI